MPKSPIRYVVVVKGLLSSDLITRISELHAGAIERGIESVPERPPDSSRERQSVRSRSPDASADDCSNKESEAD